MSTVCLVLPAPCFILFPPLCLLFIVLVVQPGRGTGKDVVHSSTSSRFTNLRVLHPALFSRDAPNASTSANVACTDVLLFLFFIGSRFCSFYFSVTPMSPRWWHRSRSFFSVCPVSLVYHTLRLPPETIANARRDAIAIKTISAQHYFRDHSAFFSSYNLYKSASNCTRLSGKNHGTGPQSIPRT